jgi:hypothetical protein
MKNLLSIVSALAIASTLTLTACGKDKKAATAEPAAAEPPKTEPAKTDTPPAEGEKKAEEKPKGGW